VRSGEAWTQQGSKLVGTGGSPVSGQGFSVSLSSDGNTLAVGGPDDISYVGGTWVFTRNGTSWTQQGGKLLGTGVANSTSSQGFSVSLSSGGNTLAVGGYGGDSNVDATWVFTRTGSAWTQQGGRLVGTGFVDGSPDQGVTYQGSSVSLSSDGNTLAVGRYGDDDGVGATWVFTRSGSTWAQQGDKLVGTGIVNGLSSQGSSVSLSSDGNKLVVAGAFGVSSIWIFTRNGSSWTQLGARLPGTGGVISLGSSVSLSSDGNSLAFVGYVDFTSSSWVGSLSGSCDGPDVSDRSSSSSGLPVHIVIGIVVACALGAGVVAAVSLLVWRRQRRALDAARARSRLESQQSGIGVAQVQLQGVVTQSDVHTGPQV